MKKTVLFFTLLLSFSIQAQVSLKVSKNYPAHIVYKIDDVLSKVKLDEGKQIKIAKKFQKMDSLANASLSRGLPVEQSKALYVIDNSFLKDILSLEELEYYAFKMDKDNRFLAVLNSIPYTKLQAEQINKIRQLNDSLETTPKMSFKKMIQFQNWKLSKILHQEQYVALLKLIYKDQSLTDAKTDWERILKLKINTPGKEVEEFQKITDYHLNKNSFLDKQADRFEKKKRDFFTLKTNLMRPLLLIHANILSNPNKTTNKYASLILFENELNLSENQIDSLLIKYKQFEKITIENLEIDIMEKLTLRKQLPSQFENILQIVTSEQLNNWFVLKNKEEARVRGYKSWAKLEQEGLTKDLDKEKTIKELSVYHLKYLVAAEKVRNWKTPESRFLIRDAEQTKPEILQQLDAITRSKANNQNAKNAMAW